MGSAGRTYGRALAPAVLFVLVTGCQDKLPSAPSVVTTGITIYEHANFLGASAHLTRDVRNLADYDGPCEHTVASYPVSQTVHNWDGCISSVRVAPGWRATLYRETDFEGQSLQLTSDAPNLQLAPGSCPHDGLNDCISSVRVRMQ